MKCLSGRKRGNSRKEFPPGLKPCPYRKQHKCITMTKRRFEPLSRALWLREFMLIFQ